MTNNFCTIIPIVLLASSLVGGCRSGDIAETFPEYSQPPLQFSSSLSVAGPSPEPAKSPEPTRSNLQVTQIYVDETGPRGLVEAWDQSEAVVVGTIVEEIGGVRFYGGNSPEDPGDVPWFEDVNFRVEIATSLKGDLLGEALVQWPAYLTEEQSNDTRIAKLDYEGITVPDIGSTYVLFLKDWGEPFGLAKISHAGAAMTVEDDGTIGELVSTNYTEYRGLPLQDVLPPRG